MFRVNLDNATFNFIISIPKLEFTGKYNLKIKILGIFYFYIKKYSTNNKARL